MNDTSFDINVLENIGGVILSWKEGKLLEFELVYVTMEREGTSTSVEPRAWIASYDGKDCCWNCAPLSRPLVIRDPCTWTDTVFEQMGRCFGIFMGVASLIGR